MDNKQKIAIKKFFTLVDELEKLGIIRSSRILGDIGEFLCHSKFGLKLSLQLRQKGHDAIKGKDRVQIKFSNSTKGNNIKVGDPRDYEELVLVIGPKSKLKEEDHPVNGFKFYCFNNETVKRWKEKSGFYCAKRELKDCHLKESM